MSLQPTNSRLIDRSTTAPFLLRLYFRSNHTLEPSEFSVAPPPDTTNITDYSSLLPASLRQQSVQIYTWPTCTLSELTGLLTSVLPEGLLPKPSVGTRLVYKLIFPDTRGQVSESGRGKWIDKPLGSVVIGEQQQQPQPGDIAMDDAEGPHAQANGDDARESMSLVGDAQKTLADARFVIGDYVACTIYPPGADGRVAPMPVGRHGYGAPRGPPPMREGGYGGGDFGGSRGYRGGYGGGRGSGFGAAPPPGDWRRGERVGGYEGAYGRGGGYRGRGGGGRPY